MATQWIDASNVPAIEVIVCNGDLIIKPWLDQAVQAAGTYELIETANKNKLVFQAEGDLRLLVPIDIAISVGNVLGDLVIKGIRGAIQIGETSGDAVLQNLSQVEMGKVHGDLSAKNINGNLEVEMVYGDALVRSIDGDLNVDSVFGDTASFYVNGSVYLVKCMGDVSLRTVSGNVTIKTGQRDANLRNIGGLCSIGDIRGDIRLQGGLCEGEHDFSAAGDIVVRWPVDAPLQLTAKAAEITNRLPLEDMKELDDSLVGQIGEGDTVVSLTACGRINLKGGQLIYGEWGQEDKEAFNMDFMIDFSDLGERISAEVSESVAGLAKEVEKSFGPDFAEKLSAKVSRQAEKAARKAEAAVEKAQNYAQREAMRAESNRKSPMYAPKPRPSAKSESSAGKVSSDEQLKILRMVENGTISPDEAVTLLEALEQ